MRVLHVVFAAGLLSPTVASCSCDELAGGPPDGGSGNADNDGGQGAGDDDAGFIGDSGVPVACVDDLASITVSPAHQDVTLSGSAAAPLAFTATGALDDGTVIELQEAALAWSATRGDDGDPGTINAGTLAPNPLLGGTVTVSATDGCVVGSATVTFTIDAVLGTPVNPDDWQGTPVSAGPLPEIVYPSDQTRFPRNIHQTLFQWRSGGADEFRLTFQGAGSTVTVFTDGAHLLCSAPDAACFEADEAAWALIAGSNAGGTVTWTVDALDRSTPTPTIRRGASITIGFSLRDVRGAIFYWSTTSAGVRRANVGDPDPEDYLVGKPVGTNYAVEGQVKCVACHVVSRDGRKLAAPVETTGRHKSLWIADVTLTAPPFPRVSDVDDTEGHGFATFSPDASLVMAAWGGPMWLVDAATGAFVADVDLAGGEGTAPDWSPDGTQVANSNKRGDAPASAAIAVLPVTGATTFAAPEILIAQAGDRTNLYPMFSPDGRWLAFSRGKGGHGDDEMQLFVVDALGARPGTPVELVNANRVVSNELTDGQHQNAAPTWAPPGDLAWVAFNSKRPYGLVDEDGGQQQIWVAAVDPAALESGAVDPSWPAFRLQFQGLDEDNHRAFWALDVREEPPPVDAGPPLPDAGAPPDAGPPPPCVLRGGACDPVTDSCCEAIDRCLTADDGATYLCVPFLGG